ncbi:XdhC family protein [Shewanella donghaensis]|uniref:XdhC family protein n=1 Tax=Shewanella donghaensis TaxID=238836 RepID=UPI001184091C|nr:XdhC/CoxI family protein [Shewanella donghaensis]
MAHHLLTLLDIWAETAQQDWTLAVITSVEGSSYRKPGAIMLFDPLGKTLGMLSGGCLEADLRRHAQKAIQTQEVQQLTYDATDENDTSYQLGCGGLVNIMMVPLLADNQYLGLPELHQQLTRGGKGTYQLTIAKQGAHASQVNGLFVVNDALLNPANVLKSDAPKLKSSAQLTIENDIEILKVPLRSPFHIGVFGGGLDAQPLVTIAHQLDWKVTVFDSRSAYARSYDFPVAKICKTPIEQLEADELNHLDAAVIMNHNLDMDAKALKLLQLTDIAYIALLGPTHRRDKVLLKSELSVDDFKGFFSAPAGLALGGELPSSVALSILSQCHGVLHHGLKQQDKLSSLDKVMSS